MNESILKGKKVIFFCPIFFGYENAILRELEDLGADVTFHSGRPSEHPWFKGFLRLFPLLAWLYSDSFFLSWLKRVGPKTCDLIFIVKGEGLSPNFLKALRARYPNSHVVLYLFDNLANCKYMELKFPYIDEIFSFDPLDCKAMQQFKYRPLFFLNEYLGTDAKEQNHRLFFLGTLNGDRPKIIYKVLASLTRNVVCDYWLYVRNRLELVIRRVFDRYLRKLDASRLLFTPMSFETIKSNLNRCDAVLDIEHPKQTGLTMRTFEVIASGKKLITTNGMIKDHDFYDPARICIIDRHAPSIPSDFMISQVPPLSENFIAKYSLHGWLLEILGSIPSGKVREL